MLLRQILFYRELGFELKQIQRLLGRSAFDRIAALKLHRALSKAIKVLAESRLS